MSEQKSPKSSRHQPASSTFSRSLWSWIGLARLTKVLKKSKDALWDQSVWVENVGKHYSIVLIKHQQKVLKHSSMSVKALKVIQIIFLNFSFDIEFYLSNFHFSLQHVFSFNRVFIIFDIQLKLKKSIKWTDSSRTSIAIIWIEIQQSHTIVDWKHPLCDILKPWSFQHPSFEVCSSFVSRMMSNEVVVRILRNHNWKYWEGVNETWK